MNFTAYLSLFSALSFLFFGIACFVNPQMKTEFKRYKLGVYRNLVGFLQILGSLGLVIGVFHSPVLVSFAAAGLCILMLLGFCVRLKIKDTVLQSAPSLIYAIINGYIFYSTAIA
jgi:hypothetical protein